MRIYLRAGAAGRENFGTAFGLGGLRKRASAIAAARSTTMSRVLPLLSFAAALLWCSGCSTPSSRIHDNPQAFAALSPHDQALVKAGQVGIGMTMAAVKLAMGDPDRITTRTDGGGESQVWHYVVYEDNGVFLYSGYYHRGWRGGWDGGVAYPYYLDYPRRTVHDRFRVEFRNGRVASVTQENPPA